MASDQGPLSEPAPEALLDHLIALGSRLLEDRHAAVAYHRLAASVEYADEQANGEWLTRTEQLATEWQARLDAEKPAHKFSTEGAQSRGMPAIFTTLARTAKAARAGARAKAHQAEHR
jgi:hypothetical protein